MHVSTVACPGCVVTFLNHFRTSREGPDDWRLFEALSTMGMPGHEAGAFLADHVVDGAILLPVQT